MTQTPDPKTFVQDLRDAIESVPMPKRYMAKIADQKTLLKNLTENGHANLTINVVRKPASILFSFTIIYVRLTDTAESLAKNAKCHINNNNHVLRHYLDAVDKGETATC